MLRLTVASVLMTALCCVALCGMAFADSAPMNDTYNTAFHVWDVCGRGDCGKAKCNPCPKPCAPKCEPCSPVTCSPPPCPPPAKCCPKPVCDYPDPCDREEGDFARNTVSRQDA